MFRTYKPVCDQNTDGFVFRHDNLAQFLPLY
ncbi:MAG: hypothetical protein PWR15_849 [Bacteroidota bacterium]|jgi:hypothetical protein|nr:hypothetical protein [Bacteroidota bacterium]